MTATDLITEFQIMYAGKWQYAWGAAEKGKVDCSGAFTYAFKKHGLSIYHGSNTIARKYIVKLLPISDAKPGMAAFKVRKPGAKNYSLPTKYKDDADKNDYYHIGLVDADPAYVLNAQSTATGFVRSPIDQWAYVAYLKQVDYNDQSVPLESAVSATDLQRLREILTEAQTIISRMEVHG